MKVKEYEVLARAVEEGVGWGLTRYNKYAPNQLSGEAEMSLKDHLEREIMNALCDVFDFESGEPDEPYEPDEPPDEVA